MLWSTTGAIRSLPALTEEVHSEAFGINEAGTMVGYAADVMTGQGWSVEALAGAASA